MSCFTVVEQSLCPFTQIVGMILSAVTELGGVSFLLCKTKIFITRQSSFRLGQFFCHWMIGSLCSNVLPSNSLQIRRWAPGPVCWGIETFFHILLRIFYDCTIICAMRCIFSNGNVNTLCFFFFWSAWQNGLLYRVCLPGQRNEEKSRKWWRCQPRTLRDLGELWRWLTSACRRCVFLNLQLI